MRFKPAYCKRLPDAAPVKQASHFTGQAHAGRQVHKRPYDLQVPDNKAEAVPGNRLRIFIHRGGSKGRGILN
jgi:hypothetical protein